MTPIGSVFWRSFLLLFFVWGIWARTAWKGKTPKSALARLRGLSRRTWFSLLAAGALSLALGGFFFALALKFAPASIVTPITASSPLLTALFARFCLKERTRPLQWAGIAMIVIGSVAVGS
jgi:drug/metabolite transporter (DMT)-like permease